MQSLNINRTVQLVEVLQDLFEGLKESTAATVDAIVGDAVTFVGDFSRFTFTENPANNTEKILVVTKGAESNFFEKCTLIDGSTVSAFMADDSSLALEVGDALTIKEAAPFFFEGTQSSVYLLQKAQPAAVLLNPQGHTLEYSETSNGLNASYNRVQLIFTDFSNDFETGNDSLMDLSKGFVNSNYVDYVQKPLGAWVAKFLAALDGYTFTNGVVRATVEHDTTTATANFVEFFGQQSSFPDTELENISGWVLDLNIKLIGAACLGSAQIGD